MRFFCFFSSIITVLFIIIIYLFVSDLYNNSIENVNAGAATLCSKERDKGENVDAMDEDDTDSADVSSSFGGSNKYMEKYLKW